MELRAKFTFEDIKKLSEPRFCYKYKNNQNNMNGEIKHEEIEEEQSDMKKMVIVNNAKFLP